MAEIYFSGQGKVYLGDRDGAGAVATYRNIGNVPSISLTLETDVLEHKESTTGQRLTDLRLTRERTASITITLEEFSLQNLQLLLYGTTSNVSGATSSDELLTDNLVSGDIVSVANPHVTTWTLIEENNDSAMTLDVDYEITDSSAGLIKLLTTPASQPIKATYDFATQDLIPMFRQPSQERFLQFSGLNTADSDASVIVELYRVVFDPVGNMELINDELGQYELEGSVLYDATRDLDSTLGGFGRIVRPQ